MHKKLYKYLLNRHTAKAPAEEDPGESKTPPGSTPAPAPDIPVIQ